MGPKRKSGKQREYRAEKPLGEVPSRAILAFAL